MTDDELRGALAERLGYSDLAYEDGELTGRQDDMIGACACLIPSLAELVATGEGRLKSEQDRAYYAVLVGESLLVELDSLLDQFCLITAPAAVRAKALLEVLPESSLTGDGGVG